MDKIVVTYREGIDDKPDWWELFIPLYMQLSDGNKICIPAGYITDFASIPPILWSLFPPIGKYNRASLVHDYLYDTQYKQNELGENIARKFADDEFLRIANTSDPKSKTRHYIMYLMIRWFGKSAWKSLK
jgi:hypothetical protein